MGCVRLQTGCDQFRHTGSLIPPKREYKAEMDCALSAVRREPWVESRSLHKHFKVKTWDLRIGELDNLPLSTRMICLWGMLEGA